MFRPCNHQCIFAILNFNINGPTCAVSFGAESPKLNLPILLRATNKFWCGTKFSINWNAEKAWHKFRPKLIAGIFPQINKTIFFFEENMVIIYRWKSYVADVCFTQERIFAPLEIQLINVKLFIAEAELLKVVFELLTLYVTVISGPSTQLFVRKMMKFYTLYFFTQQTYQQLLKCPVTQTWGHRSIT